MKTQKNFQKVEEAMNLNSFEHVHNGKKFITVGSELPKFLKPEDFKNQELQLISENYQSEYLRDEDGNLKTFYEFVSVETGEFFISEQFGHLKHLINQIPEVNRKMPLFLLINYKGKFPMKNNPKVQAHNFSVKWANL